MAERTPEQIGHYVSEKVGELNRIIDSRTGLFRGLRTRDLRRRAHDLSIIGIGVAMGTGEINSDEAMAAIKVMAGEEPTDLTETEFAALLEMQMVHGEVEIGDKNG